MNYQEYIVPMIAAFVFLLLLIVKPFLKEHSKYLPLIAGVLGVLGNTWANNWTFNFPTFLEGLASGLAATGVDQFVKMANGHYYNEDEDLSVEEIEVIE